MICQCMFIDCNKCTVGADSGVLTVGEALFVGNRGHMGTPLSTEFCCGPKTAPKNSLLIIEKRKEC